MVIRRTLVGILTGPLTLSLLSLPPRTKSAQTVKENFGSTMSQTILQGKFSKKDETDNQLSEHRAHSKFNLSC